MDVLFLSLETNSSIEPEHEIIRGKNTAEISDTINSDLADLLETIHIVLCLMEKLQNRGTLRVSRKARKQRKKKTTKDTNEAEVATQGKDKENPENAGRPFAELSKPDTVDKELGASISDPTTEPGMATLGPEQLTDDSSHVDNEKSNNNFIDPVYNTDGSSSEDETPATSELSLMTTFHEILADQKSSMSREYKNIVDFLSKVVRKRLRTIKHQPLLFVELLFWKTRKECHCINAEVLQGDLTTLKGEIRNLDGEVGQPNDRVGSTYKSIAEYLLAMMKLMLLSSIILTVKGWGIHLMKFFRKIFPIPSEVQDLEIAKHPC